MPIEVHLILFYMKKAFLPLLVMAFLAMNSQNSLAYTVNPITLKLTSFSLDSLNKAFPNIDDYIVVVQDLQQTLKHDKEYLNGIASELKQEMAQYKAECNMLKDRQRQINAQEKVYKSELKMHQSDRKLLEKQRKEVRKNEVLDASTQRKQLDELTHREARLDRAEQECNKKLFDLQKEREVLKNDMIQNADYNYALQQKSSQLKALIAENKTQMQQVANAVKAIKNALKAKASTKK